MRKHSQPDIKKCIYTFLIIYVFAAFLTPSFHVHEHNHEHEEKQLDFIYKSRIQHNHSAAFDVDYHNEVPADLVAFSEHTSLHHNKFQHFHLQESYSHRASKTFQLRKYRANWTDLNKVDQYSSATTLHFDSSQQFHSFNFQSVSSYIFSTCDLPPPLV